MLDDHADAAGNWARRYRNDGEMQLLYEAVAFEWVRLYATPGDNSITNRNTMHVEDPLDFELVYDADLWENVP